MCNFPIHRELYCVLEDVSLKEAIQSLLISSQIVRLIVRLDTKVVVASVVAVSLVKHTSSPQWPSCICT